MTQVLIVEDDFNYCELIKDHLIRDGFDVQSARTLSEALGKLSIVAPDAVVLDLDLPDSPRDRTVEVVKSHTTAPIVVLCGSGSDVTAKESISKSAFGFMDKNRGLMYLGTEVRKAIKSVSRILEIQSAISKIEQNGKPK